MEPIEAVRRWQAFAEEIKVLWGEERRTWKQHLAANNRRGYADEEVLLQPIVFPKFAVQLLGFVVGETLAPEVLGQEGKPDFRPADAGTHPFVFETKSTNARSDFSSFSEQIERYLLDGRPRIRRVVITNLRHLEVYELNSDGQVALTTSVALIGLLEGEPEVVAASGDARRLAAFLDEHRFQQLSANQKLERIRQAEEWNPALEVTNPGWISRQLDRVVELLRADVTAQIHSGAFDDDARFSSAHRRSLLDELVQLEYRLGGLLEVAESRSLDDYVRADEDTLPGKALRQLAGHAAYFVSTRLLVVRIWEDLGLIEELLRDGGFDEWMRTFRGSVAEVVARSYSRARQRYASLFEAQNNYTWYQPESETHINVIFELSNTYFGAINSDVLGDVYERLLERIDRKNIGQFYTPRDAIRLIWDLIGLDDVAAVADESDRELRVLDIATGSGGFLVDAAQQLRTRAERQWEAGAAIGVDTVMKRLSKGLVGSEIQVFPAYLAEVNLLVQLSFLLARDERVQVVPLSILCTDTMSLHEPRGLDEESGLSALDALLHPDSFREDRWNAVKDVDSSGFVMDVACGNPPYVGETRASPVLRRTREQFPYWNDFVAPHLDVLYWFLILGVSKLREGGRFGFITTEYWLRAQGAAPLREYLADRCEIDRIVLFGNMKLFPDAPGQHSMVVTGRRVAARGGRQPHVASSHKPVVSVYNGPNLSVEDRAPVLDKIRERRARGGLGVSTFVASVSPNDLRSESWGEVPLTPGQFRKRQAMLANAQPLEVEMEEGVIATPDRLRRSSDAGQLSRATLEALGYPEQKPGVFVLTAEEVVALGNLTAAERRVLRPIANTRNVFPYAVVVEDDAEAMIYLARPDDLPSDRAEVQTLPFPSNMPALEAHLGRFRSLLMAKVEGWGEKRPWWSVHRHRPKTMGLDPPGTTDRWARFALTTRWGAGEHLLVGVAPSGTVPASGLHSIVPVDRATAAYVTGLMMSTPVQELAEGLPPGQLRQEDLRLLRLPMIPQAVEALGATALELADLVAVMVKQHSGVWPLLADALRADVDLSVLPTDAWSPDAGPASSWGPLRRVGWVEGIESSGAQSNSAKTVSVQRDLFGPALNVEGQTTGRLRIRLTVDDDEALHALADFVRGRTVMGALLRDIPETAVPTDLSVLLRRRSADTEALFGVAANYRELRANADELVATVL